MGESYAEVRDRVLNGPAPAPREPRPRMIAVDLSNDTTHHIARCCDNPVPVAKEVGGRKDRKFFCDLVCASCGDTLAVLRWRLERKGGG